MEITDALLGEHAVFYALFDHLERIVPTVDAVDEVKSQGALLAAALETHAALEDSLLFDALERRIGSAGPLMAMRMEHDLIEARLQQVVAVEQLGEAQQLLLEVIETAREHFSKEELALFRIAQQALSPEVLTDLGEQWAAQRAVSLL